LAEKFLSSGAPLDYLSHHTSDGNILNESFIGDFSLYFGYPLLGIKRTVVLRLLHDELNRQSIPVHFNKSLCALSQSNDQVTAEFGDGTKVTGDYLIGCDGLRSTVRQLLFGSDQSTYTGLTQTIGITERMDPLDRSTMLNVYGEGGTHFITYPFDANQACFACTFREPIADTESWRSLSNEQALMFVRECGFAQWASPVDKCIANTSRLFKIGVYDRPELSTWHKDRVILTGDAAHATSPHIGQGANQAMEDAYYLVKFWKMNVNNHIKAFEDYTQLRKERTTRLVQAARRQGEARVCTKPEECQQRNAMLIKGFNINDFRWIYDIEL
jgi:salicylate hydroxylase